MLKAVMETHFPVPARYDFNGVIDMANPSH
jgi:hypothetical protein